MKTLVSSSEAAALDIRTKNDLCLRELQLMEKATIRLWDSIRAALPNKGSKDMKILALAGKGNNGGDALAVLRHAWSAGFANVSAIVSSEHLSPSCSAQAESLASIGARMHPWSDVGLEMARRMMGQADVVLDGILGTGINGPARGEAREMIQAFPGQDAMGSEELVSGKREGRPFIVSIDVPSGLGDFFTLGFPAVRADICCTLAPLKLALLLPDARRFFGALRIVEDVFPATLVDIAGRNEDGASFRNAILLEEEDMHSLLPKVPNDAYKMSRGKVSVFAGSHGHAGAARLCAKAVGAGGAGYCTLHADPDICGSLVPEIEPVVVSPWDGSGVPESSCHVFIVGPGWGEKPTRKAVLEDLIAQRKPVVADASALRLLASLPDARAGKDACLILTPHPGEYAALAMAKGIPAASPFLDSLPEVAKAYGALVVYKSHVTAICDLNGNLSIWDGMNPALGTAGSGDVLSGLIAGVVGVHAAQASVCGGRLDQGQILRAVQGAVILHGVAGRNLARTEGWFSADRLIKECARLAYDSMNQSKER